MSRSSVAVAHDHFYRWGGGEAVACALSDAFDAPLYTSFLHRDAARQLPAKTDVTELIAGHPLENVFRKHFQESGKLRTLFYMFLWEVAPCLREYDVVVQSGNNPGWYVPDDDQTVVKYTHSTPRQAFDLFSVRADTLDESPLTAPRAAAGVAYDRVFKKFTRYLWSTTTTYPTLWVANSDIVAARIRKYFGVNRDRIRVVYPPVNVSQYEPTDGGEYYLSLGRLSTHKNTDVVVRAFRELGQNYRLKVAGIGPDGDDLRRIAAGSPNIEFVGFVTDDEKRELFRNATATVFMADNEDFGIVPVESMAAGTPVIGVDDGFTQYQVRDGENGLKAECDAAAVASAVQRFESGRASVSWGADELHAYAQQFGRDRFEEQMRDAVRVARDMDRPTPAIRGPQVVQ